MVSEKQIDTVARMLDPDAFTLEKTMLLMKGEMFGHHGDRVRAARVKAEELLTAAEQAELAPATEPVAYLNPTKPNEKLRQMWKDYQDVNARKATHPTPSEPAAEAEPVGIGVFRGGEMIGFVGLDGEEYRLPEDSDERRFLYTHPKRSDARLREALEKVLEAIDQGRLVERGVGGMTVDAQLRRSVYNGVPAWPIEEARAALKEASDERS